jgi:hypothetical protein
MEADFTIRVDESGIIYQTFNGRKYTLWAGKRYFSRRQSISMHREVYQRIVFQEGLIKFKASNGLEFVLLLLSFSFSESLIN